MVRQSLQSSIGRVLKNVTEVENGGLAQHLTERAHDSARVLVGLCRSPDAGSVRGRCGRSLPARSSHSVATTTRAFARSSSVTVSSPKFGGRSAWKRCCLARKKACAPISVASRHSRRSERSSAARHSGRLTSSCNEGDVPHRKGRRRSPPGRRFWRLEAPPRRRETREIERALRVLNTRIACGVGQHLSGEEQSRGRINGQASRRGAFGGNHEREGQTADKSLQCPPGTSS